MEEMTYVLTKIPKSVAEAAKASGKGLSSGGARAAGGQLMGQYRYVAELGNLGKPAEVFSSQMANLSVGMDKVAASLTTLNQGMNGITSALTTINSTLQVMQGLAWFNSVMSVVNCAIMVEGFARISDQLVELSNKVDALADQIETIHNQDLISEIHSSILNLRSAIDKLNKRGLQDHDILMIEGYLNKASLQIKWLVDYLIKSETEDSGAVFHLLYDMASIYANVLKEYGAQHYYLTQQYPMNYEVWTGALSFVNSEDFQEVLKRTIWITKPVSSQKELETCYNVTVNTMVLQDQLLLEEKQAVPLLPEHVHMNMSEYVMQSLEKGNYEMVEAEPDDDEMVLVRIPLMEPQVA